MYRLAPSRDLSGSLRVGRVRCVCLCVWKRSPHLDFQGSLFVRSTVEDLAVAAGYRTWKPESRRESISSADAKRLQMRMRDDGG